MTGINDVDNLIIHLRKHRQVLGKICAYLASLWDVEAAQQKPGTTQSLAAAQAITNYYTCVETIFHRIAQFCKTEPHGAHWHTDLLDSMTVALEECRPAIIDDSVAADLRELLRFRHFTRYYFQFEFDWERLSLQKKTVMRSAGKLAAALDEFEAFLQGVRQSNE